MGDGNMGIPASYLVGIRVGVLLRPTNRRLGAVRETPHDPQPIAEGDVAGPDLDRRGELRDDEVAAAIGRHGDAGGEVAVPVAADVDQVVTVPPGDSER